MQMILNDVANEYFSKTMWLELFLYHKMVWNVNEKILVVSKSRPLCYSYLDLRLMPSVLPQDNILNLDATTTGKQKKKECYTVSAHYYKDIYFAITFDWQNI